MGPFSFSILFSFFMFSKTSFFSKQDLNVWKNKTKLKKSLAEKRKEFSFLRPSLSGTSDVKTVTPSGLRMWGSLNEVFTILRKLGSMRSWMSIRCARQVHIHKKIFPKRFLILFLLIDMQFPVLLVATGWFYPSFHPRLRCKMKQRD